MQIDQKTAIGIIGITAVSVIQCVAFLTGHDGVVLALTTTVIGGIVGSIFGFKLGAKS